MSIPRGEHGGHVTQVKTDPSLLVLLGSLDWLTTIVGIVYFGAVEANPFLAELARSNLPVLTIVKLGTAIFVGFLFYQAERTLRRASNQNGKSFEVVRFTHRAACFSSIAFLLFAVLNNIWTVASIAA